jgi:F0F1-type ATP synthase membrane subunit b/b'
MKNAYAELKALRQSWDRVRKERPGEADFGQFGFPDANASDFDKVLEQWDGALAATSGATRPVNAPEEKVVELIVVRALREAKTQVDAASGNGMAWMIQSSPFLQRIGEAQVAMAPVIERRFRVRKEVVQFAQSQMIGNIVAVERAAPIAQSLVDTQKSIEDQAESVAESLTQATAAKEKAVDEAGLVTQSLEHVRALASQGDEAKPGFDTTVADATRLLGEATKALEEVGAFRESADQTLGEGKTLIAQANEKLRKALADITRQALSDSFAAKAHSLGWERRGWMGGFLIAIAWLGWVAFHVAALPPSGGPSTGAISPSLWTNLLRAIPFVLPGVWLGWLSAKNAGLTARVQQDYAYKVATALAFQGYKNEVEALKDEALAKQLMEIAIRNFGENPIRIYEGRTEEGHPLEQLKSIFKDKSIIDFIKTLKSLAG